LSSNVLSSPTHFFLHCSTAHLYLHSFPTRRSSDLDHVVVENLADFLRSRNAVARLHQRGLVFLTDDVHAQFDTLIADEHCRPGKDRKSTRLNSSHRTISYAVFCLKKKNKKKPKRIT